MSIIQIVSAISDDVVAKITAAGLPPLVDGQIVIGRDKDDEASSPPRIVFIPTSFRFETRSNPVNYSATQRTNPNAVGSGIRSFTMTQYGGGYSGTPTVTVGAPDLAGGTQATASAVLTANGAICAVVPVVAGSGYLSPPRVTIAGTGTQAACTANLQQPSTALTVMQQQAFLTEWVRFEVLVWGVNSVGTKITPDPALDYVATQRLYAQVIASAQTLYPNIHVPSNGQWIDAQPDAMAREAFGHRVSFYLELPVPVLREPMVPLTGASIRLAPPQTQAAPTLYMLPTTGGVAILNATNASPIQITTASPHGLSTGNQVPIGQVTGNTAANGIWTVTVTSETTFTLNGSSGSGAYTGGGLVGAESS